MLERTGHVKVWISYATFEATEIENENVEDDTETIDEKARRVFERGYNSLKERGLKEEVSKILLILLIIDKLMSDFLESCIIRSMEIIRTRKW